MSKSAVSTSKIHDYGAHVSSPDRLGVTLFAALAFHAVALLGLSFTVPEPSTPKQATSLDVILVQTESEITPEDADFLAQADQLGGGVTEKAHKPTSQSPGEQPQKGTAQENKVATAPPKETPKPRSVLTTESKSSQQATRETKPRPKTPQRTFTASELAEMQLKMAEMQAEVDKKTQQLTKRPKATYITASTKRAADALYLKQWTDKVEQWGNLNYPDEAIRKKLNGTLVLSVTLNPDGSVLKITLNRSSKHKLLDDAAKRIVMLASPFAPVPKEVLKDNQALVITRTWVFSQGLQTRAQ